MAIEILHLSSVVKGALVDRDGDRLGRVEDLIAQLGVAPHPPVTGRRRPHRPAPAVRPHRPHPRPPARAGCSSSGDTVSLKRFERRPGEVLLSKDLRARHLINLQGARLIRANEIELARVDGRWEVVAVDPSPRVALRRLLPRAARPGASPAGKVVDWASIEPFVAHVPTARLRIPYRKLARLHPAQIADLVEAASHEEGEEIIEAVGQDRELEADVFEELDAEHQIEFVRSRTDAEAARLLATMAPDDAADLIAELDQERRLPVLQLLPPGPATQDPDAAQLQPRDRRRADEPRLPVPGRVDSGERRARGRPQQHGTPRGPGRGVRPWRRRPGHAARPRWCA